MELVDPHGAGARPAVQGRPSAGALTELMPKPPSRAFPHSALQASLEIRNARADARAPFIAELRAAGVTSQRAIADALHERGAPRHRAVVGEQCRSLAFEAVGGVTPSPIRPMCCTRATTAAAG